MKRTPLLVVWSLLAVATAFGCGPERACTPGTTQACTCTSGLAGAQTCDPAGAGFGVCVCDGSEGDAGQTDSGAPCEDVDAGTCDIAEEATLVGMGAAPDEWFGCAVALSADGSRALVGMLGDDTVLGTNAGTARVFLRSGTSWAEEATLAASIGTVADALGSRVALTAAGDRALLGAPRGDGASGTDAGRVHVFVRAGTTWTEEAVFEGDLAFDQFGDALALSADGARAIVGAVHPDRSGTGGGPAANGSARIFVRDGSAWTEETTLVASDGAADDAFGGSVALSSDASLAFVGAPRDDTAAVEEAGSVRVFRRTGTTWSPEAMLVSSDAAPRDGLGASLAASADGSRVLVGGGNDETARVFARVGATWAEEATLSGDSPLPIEEEFGYAVALSGDGSLALVGAPAVDGYAAAFARVSGSWASVGRLSGRTDERLGLSVALSSDGTLAMIGAVHGDSAGGMDTGTARVVRLSPGCAASRCGPPVRLDGGARLDGSSSSDAGPDLDATMMSFDDASIGADAGPHACAGPWWGGSAATAVDIDVTYVAPDDPPTNCTVRLWLAGVEQTVLHCNTDGSVLSTSATAPRSTTRVYYELTCPRTGNGQFGADMASTTTDVMRGSRP